RNRSERGAILVQVGLAIVVMMGFSAFVVDYGIFWLGRRQAQNAADAGAMAGAITRVYEQYTTLPDTPPSTEAVDSAKAAANANLIVGDPVPIPGTVEVQANFPCPGGIGEGECLRVDVFRDGGRGNPLPVYFSQVFGMTGQDVQAM